MMFVKKDEAVDNNLDFDLQIDNDFQVKSADITGGLSVKKDYLAYSIMLGVGAGLAVAGSIVAGIMGYKYTHSKDGSESLSFGIAPNGAVVNLTF